MTENTTRVLKCPSCHSEIQPSDEFCLNCGVRLSSVSSSGSAPSESKKAASFNCRRCGLPLTENVPFCPRCGSAASEKGCRFAFLLPAVLVFLVGLGILLILYFQSVSRYRKACDDYLSGNSEAAISLFSSLKNFADAEICSALAEKQALYQKADGLYLEGNISDAETIFSSLGFYRDSRERTAECKMNRILKNAADTDENDLRSAMRVFAVASSEPAYYEKCIQLISLNDYTEATSLTEQGKYELALALLSSIKEVPGINVSDASDACRAAIQYKEAVLAMESGDFYTAYKLFITLDDKKSLELANACILPSPGACELERTVPAVKKNADGVELTVQNKSDSDVLYKLIKSDTEEFTSVFVPSNGEYTVRIPVGNYAVHYAYGYPWFGASGLFGDEGCYFRFKSADGFVHHFESGSSVVFAFTDASDDSNTEQIERSAF